MKEIYLLLMESYCEFSKKNKNLVVENEERAD